MIKTLQGLKVLVLMYATYVLYDWSKYGLITARDIQRVLIPQLLIIVGIITLIELIKLFSKERR
jgi:hypothetical protein